MKIHDIEIKDGYLLVVKTDEEIHNMTVVSNNQDDHLGCVTPKKHFWHVDNFDKNGVFEDSEIIAIYGRTYNSLLLDNSTQERELLWERKETAKKMTVAEICKALGYEVEIVKEGQA